VQQQQQYQRAKPLDTQASYKDFAVLLSISLPYIILTQLLPRLGTGNDNGSTTSLFIPTIIALRGLLIMPLFVPLFSSSSMAALCQQALQVFTFSRPPIFALVMSHHPAVRNVLLRGSGESWAVSAFGADLVIWLLLVVAWEVVEC